MKTQFWWFSFQMCIPTYNLHLNSNKTSNSICWKIFQAGYLNSIQCDIFFSKMVESTYVFFFLQFFFIRGGFCTLCVRCFLRHFRVLLFIYVLEMLYDAILISEADFCTCTAYRPGFDSLKNCKFYDSSRNVGCSLRCNKK